MAGFKKGAFSVAVKAGVDVVPITLLGTGEGCVGGGGREGRGGRGGLEWSEGIRPPPSFAIFDGVVAGSSAQRHPLLLPPFTRSPPPLTYPLRCNDALWVGGHLAAGARAHRGARTHPHQGSGRG